MEKKAPNIAIVILAAGASRRMGSPKQLLPWKGSFLLKHTIETAQKSKANKVFVVLGANFEIIEKRIRGLSVGILKNNQWELGLGKSISSAISGINNSETEGVLLMLADQPFITSICLDQLIERFSVNANQIIATSYNDGSVGVPTLFDKSYFDELLLLNDDNGAKSIIKNNENNLIVLESGIENFDIDSIEDYQSRLSCME